MTYRVRTALFFFLFAIYLVTYTPRINSSDGLAMFATAESLVRRGALDIEQIRWMELQQGTYGLDGRLYSRKGIGLPLGMLPLTWLGWVIPWFGPVSTSLLFNGLVTALTAILILAYLQTFNFSRSTGLIVALTFGLATLAWPYAKSLFSDPFSGLLLLATAYSLRKFHQASSAAEISSGPISASSYGGPVFHFKHLGYPLLAGLFLGWNVATRYAEALFIPVFGFLLLYYLHSLLKPLKVPSIASYFSLFLTRFWPVLLIFVTPILLIGLALMGFNLSRYGDPFNTGYLPEETFSAIWLEGIMGQLISPGRGLFLYSPILLLSLWGIFPFFRRFPAESGTAITVIVIHLLLYGKWFMWHGGYAWGPRFLIPTLPFWAIFLAPFVARAWPDPNSPFLSKKQGRQGLFRLAYLILVGLSLIPQLLSVSIDFAPFQNSLLETGLPLFARETFFDFGYSPLLGAWSYLGWSEMDLAWTWQGQVNGWLLAILLINVGISGFTLWRLSQASEVARHFSSLQFLLFLSTLVAVAGLLGYTHQLPDQEVQQAVQLINEMVRPEDTVILNNPELTVPFAERYKGRGFVLGLNTGAFPLAADIEQRLEKITSRPTQIWWLPNWFPPEESAVEQKLLAEGFQVRQERFGEQRLVLFAFPQNLMGQDHPLEVAFAEAIHLMKITYPSPTEIGRALPVQLQWQAVRLVETDYHVFIHLVDEAGELVAQVDGQPVHWSRPTSTWALKEIIVDRYGLWVPPGTPGGQYQLLVGLYHPGTGQRLLLPDGGDAVRLTVILQ